MPPRLTVSDFIAVTNQAFENIYPVVEIEGEVASYKENQGKFVFFDLKDESGSVGCFMMLFQLRIPIEDGMKVVITATPKLTQWGKFSLTVKSVRPSGEGSLKKSFEILKAKLDKEGLFAVERKRALPAMPKHIAVISSQQAAGYADFIKILNDRWGGVRVDVAQVAVQGADAPDQIIRALRYFNTLEVLPEIIVIIRGGGSADDLSAFNDELMVREIAASRVPVITGIGHEIDVSLADLAADVRAATPSNVAQIIVPDRHEVLRTLHAKMDGLLPKLESEIERRVMDVRAAIQYMLEATTQRIEDVRISAAQVRVILTELDPARVLERGYALIRGEITNGSEIIIETNDKLIKAKVESYEQR